MEWISVKEKKPKAYQRVVTIRNGDIRTAEIDFYTGSFWTYDKGWSNDQKVTHWLALPELTKEK